MTEKSSPDISFFFESPSLDAETVDIVVTVPTFRRPEQLTKTLQSIAAQECDRTVCVVIMENDGEQMQGAAAAKTFLRDSSLPGLVIVAHQRGNCHAYNAGWRTVRESFPNYSAIAVIDDDEEADPHWLRNLCETADHFSVDFVGAPQVPVFESDRSNKLDGHPVFAPPYDCTGRVPILYSSGNVLIGRQVLESMPMPYLDPAFNFIGGGDSDFYSRANEHGFLFAWCATAPVFEAIPDRRTSHSWLIARSQREGAISALIENRRKPGTAGRLGTIAKSLLMLAASPVRAIKLGLRSGSPATGSYYVHVAIGRLLAEFGRINEQYRNPEAN
ncbi:MAG: glycosyltransferase family 2 protein [Hyphomicrobiales bacterium]|nr:glycosyltransferase family 2 protein [Hyphomicrobiales bacterium]MCP5000755.1 glycosyltransferase family 2 protein [Hyphomicrobiales bacterium]